jgi:hypothetical protein
VCYQISASFFANRVVPQGIVRILLANRPPLSNWDADRMSCASIHLGLAHFGCTLYGDGQSQSIRLSEGRLLAQSLSPTSQDRMSPTTSSAGSVRYPASYNRKEDAKVVA